MRRPSTLLLLPLLLAAELAVAAEEAGRIKTTAGAANVVSAGARAPATVGLVVRMGDVIETGADGSVGIAFRDTSRVSVGPNSRFTIDEFAFSPERDDYALLTRLQEGTLYYVSGLIAKLAPEKASITTPDGTIGIRGTRLLVSVRK